MHVYSFTDTRARLKEVLDRVSADKSPALITRQNGEAVVMVSLSDWVAMEETAYLLSSPRNAESLRRSIAQLDAGGGQERELLDR